MSAPEILNADSPIACPECDKLFRLPAGFTAANALACPHCQKQITGNQILEKLAPTAAMVEPPEAKAVRPTRSFDEQDFVIPKPLKTATRGRSRHPERKGAPSSSSSRSSSSKKKKKDAEPNPLTEIFKIAFGGLLALPIAQLVLWWGFNSDPLGLAPRTSSFVSFLVPPKLRPIVEVDEEEDQADEDMPGTQKLHDDNVPMTIAPK